MPTITTPYKPELTKQTKFRNQSVEFGDGYEQRSRTGINTIIESWDVTFVTQTIGDGDALELILKNASGVDPIDWQPPDSNTTKKWIVKSYQTTCYPPSQVRFITCTLKSINEL